MNQHFSNEEDKKAYSSYHTTISQAIEIAKKSKAKRLILTHFSRKMNYDRLDSISYNDYPCVIFNSKFYFLNNEK